jgi:putative transferase (TIGR04331 family)
LRFTLDIEIWLLRSLSNSMTVDPESTKVLGPDTKRLFLAATGLKSTWADHGPDVFLGEWCFRFPEDVELARRARLVAYPWTPHEARIKGIDFCQLLTRRILSGLASFFSELLDDDLDERQLTLLLAPTLGMLVQPAYHHFLCLKSAIEQYGPLRSSGLRREDYGTPNTTQALLSALRGDGFHLQLFTSLCRPLGIPLVAHSRKDLASQWSASEASGHVRPPERRRSPAERWLRGAAKRILQLGSRQARCVLYNVSFSTGEALGLAARSGLAIRPLPLVKLDSVLWPAPAPDLRREFSARLTSILEKNPFEMALGEILPSAWPISLLEGIGALQKVVAGSFPPSPRTITSSMAWLFDDAFKLWCFRSLKRGSRLVSGQHGGNYGTWPRPDADEAIEYAVADRFISWGGSRYQAASCVTLPVPPHFLIKRARRTDERILYVATSLSRWPVWIANREMGPMFLRYIERQIEFWHALPSILQSRLLLRPDPDDLGWSLRQRLRHSIPQLNLDDFSQSFVERLSKTRLSVIDNLNTTFLQSMASDVPTILFWDPVICVTNDIAGAYIDDLEAAGVFFRCPKTAAAAVARIWPDVQSWWESSPVAAAVGRFLDHYMKRDRNWVRPWLNELLADDKTVAPGAADLNNGGRKARRALVA